MHSPSSGIQEVWVSLGLILGPAEPQRWSCPWAPSDWWLSSRGASEALGSAPEKGVCTALGVGASVAPSTTRRMRGSLCRSAASTCLGASRSGLPWGASGKMRSQHSWVPRTVSPGLSPHLHVQPSPSGRKGAPFPRPCSVGAESKGCVYRVHAPAPLDLHAGTRPSFTHHLQAGSLLAAPLGPQSTKRAAGGFSPQTHFCRNAAPSCEVGPRAGSPARL